MLSLWVQMEEFPPIEIQFSEKSTVSSLRQEVCKKKWQFIFPGARMDNTVFYRIENVAVKDFKAQLNEYENVVELEDDHTPLRKFEWPEDNVHVVIMNPKHKYERSSDKSALTSFEGGEKSSFTIYSEGVLKLSCQLKVTEMERNFLLTHILTKKINDVNSNFKVTKTGHRLKLEYLKVDEANAVEEFSKNFTPKPPKISKTETLRLPVKRKLGEGSKDKEASTTNLSENSPAAFNPLSITDTHGEMQQKLRLELHTRDRGCVITKSSICTASHIIDYAWQKVPYMQGLPSNVKGIIDATGINNPQNAILLRRDIDSCFDSKKLSIVPVDEQGLPIPWPLYIETSIPNENVPASYKLWAFCKEASSYHLKPLLFEPYLLNEEELPSFPDPVLLQHHFMQSLFLNLKGDWDLTSDNDEDNDDNIVPIWEVSRKTS